MIYEVLSIITEKLNDYLNSFYDLPETLAILSEPGGEESEEGMNRMQLSLLNVEREGAAGFAAGFGGETGQNVSKRSPAWHVNLYFVVSAVFEDKRYSDGLKMLSIAMGFLQSQGMFTLPGGRRFTVELVSLSLQELTNVWSILGGRYSPSIVCKVRMLTFDSSEMRGVVTRVKKSN